MEFQQKYRYEQEIMIEKLNQFALTQSDHTIITNMKDNIMDIHWQYNNMASEWLWLTAYWLRRYNLLVKCQKWHITCSIHWPRHACSFLSITSKRHTFQRWKYFDYMIISTQNNVCLLSRSLDEKHKTANKIQIKQA